MLDPTIARLSVEEKLVLVEEIWDSIAAASDELPVTDEERREIRARVAALDRDPDDVIAWEDVKNRIGKR